MQAWASGARALTHPDKASNNVSRIGHPATTHGPSWTQFVCGQRDRTPKGGPMAWHGSCALDGTAFVQVDGRAKYRMSLHAAHSPPSPAPVCAPSPSGSPELPRRCVIAAQAGATRTSHAGVACRGWLARSGGTGPGHVPRPRVRTERIHSRLIAMSATPYQRPAPVLKRPSEPASTRSVPTAPARSFQVLQSRSAPAQLCLFLRSGAIDVK